MRRTVAFIFCVVCAAAAVGQGLEDWIEKSDHPDDLHEWIEELRRAPLDLNAASREQIAALPMFDDQHARAIIVQRDQAEGFRSLQDVLANAVLSEGQRQVLRELTTVLWPPTSSAPRARGYLTLEQRGAPNGETSLAKSAARMQAVLHSDRQTGYVYARRQADDADVIRQAAVGLEIRPRNFDGRVLAGDFQYEAGTGLVFASAYGMANWLSAPYGVKPEAARGLVLKPSADRRLLLRGGAATVASRWAEAVLIGSTTTLDAAVSNGAVERITEGETETGALAQARHDRLRESLAGFSVAANIRNIRVGTVGYYAHYSPELASTDVGSRALAGDHLKTGSAFAQVRTSNLSAVGEVAASNPGGNAWQAAAAWNRELLEMSFWHVHADANFHAPRSQVWGGYGAEANNLDASGIRVRATGGRHTLWLSANLERTPFRTSQSPLSLSSSDVEMRWALRLSSVVNGEMLLGRTQREDAAENTPSRTVRVDRARWEVRFREQEDYKIRFELRAAHGNALRQTGTLLFAQGKARVYGLDLLGRLTFFHLDASELRTAVYENAPAGSYPLVALAGRGTRAAILIGRQWSKIALAAKAALTERAGVDMDRRTMDVMIMLSFRQ